MTNTASSSNYKASLAVHKQAAGRSTTSDYGTEEKGATFVFPELALDFGGLPPHRPIHTDIPVLEDLFSELNSDASSGGYDEHDYNEFRVTPIDAIPRSEPIDLADIERILLPGAAASRRRNFNHRLNNSLFRQPFSSRLSSFLANSQESLSEYNNKHGNPFLVDDVPFFSAINAENNSVPKHNAPNPFTSSLIHLQDAVGWPVMEGKIQVKVINNVGNNGVSMNSFAMRANRINSSPRQVLSATPMTMKPSKTPNLNASLNNPRPAPSFNYLRPTSMVKVIQHQPPSAPSSHNPPSNSTAGVPAYRPHGKKRYMVGPEYADFVCRLQNDIPFDSSEEDEDETYKRRGAIAGKFNRNTAATSKRFKSDVEDEYYSDTEEEEDDEEEEFRSDKETKISSQELFELFEEQCQEFQRHPKTDNRATGTSAQQKQANYSVKQEDKYMPSLSRSQLPVTQTQFDQLQGQIHQHFQFLVQNLALSNEIEGGEGITLISLKLLVQLHLHLDTTCNLLATGSSTAKSHSGGSIDLSMISAAATAPETGSNSSLMKSARSISCLQTSNAMFVNSACTNPVSSRLTDLVPLGIGKVAVIAGFLARPTGQKQVLSLAALRQDPTLKAKSTCVSLSMRLKPHLQLAGATVQLLSNAFYNIITLFHDHIDAKLLERTINVEVLAKYLEVPTTQDSLLIPAVNESNVVSGTKSAKFNASEDALLLCGMRRFGCGNWESVQAQFLPNRSARQLAIRYKNLSSRREPMNPVKAFNEEMMRPLSEIEEDLLVKGVQRFGKEFYLISRHYLPHRPATILRRIWKALEEDDKTRSL